MKLRYYSLSMFLLILSQSVFSQQDDYPDTLLSGRKALTFTFDNFRLGGGLGGKYWLEDSRVLRLTLTGSFRKDTDESTPTTSYPYNYNTSWSQFGITIGIAQRFLRTHVVVPYAGIAGKVEKSWNKIERVYSNRTETESYTTTAIGGDVFLGVEYWFVDHISLSGEQSISLTYSMLRDSKVFQIGNSTSSLVLSVYF